MGFPTGTIKVTSIAIAANASYPTSSSEPVAFDLSQCDAAWWGAVTDLGDIVVYDLVTDSLRPRYICPTSSIVAKTGWGVCDSAISPLGRTLYLCVVPGAGAVNAAAAHTNSNCFSALGFDVESGNIPDKSGNYTGTATNLSYSQTGIICKSAGFNGNNSQVSLGTVTQLNGVAEYSISLLMTWNNLSQVDELIYYVVDDNYRIRIRSASGTLYFLIGNGSGISTSISMANTGITAGQPFHMVFTARNGTAYLYINGVSKTLAGSHPATLPNFGAVPFLIGRTSFSLDGTIDELRLRTKLMSTAEAYLEYKNLMDHANFATYSASFAPKKLSVSRTSCSCSLSL